jgi:dienelactone hydrolase
MSKVRMRVLATIAAVGAMGLAAPSGASGQEYDETQNWLNSYGRTVDHMTAPDRSVQTALISAENLLATIALSSDRVPERGAQQTGAWPWSGDTDRGSYDHRRPWTGQKIEFEFTNRTGHELTATVWAPSGERLEELGLSSPLPGVIYSGGVISSQPMYYWFAQGMADAGYVVMTYDVTGQGRSEGQATGNAPDDLRDAIDFFLSTPSERYPRRDENSIDFNPLHGMLDRDRVGTAGHSMGAGAVQTVGDHGGVVKAISAQSDLRASYDHDVPIQGQGADYESFIFPPQPSPGSNPDGKLAGYHAQRDRGIDVQEVVIESGSHMAWSHVTWAYTSVWSEAVAHWYGLAWFDRYLHGDLRRDPATGLPSADGQTGTERATLNYEAIPGHGVSKKFRSAWHLGGVECPDMVAGCEHEAPSTAPGPDPEPDEGKDGKRRDADKRPERAR